MAVLSVADHSPLGKSTAYAEHYDSSLLFPIPRQAKRDELGLNSAALPFVGEDLWNAYEISWLTPRGKPEVALARFRVPANSPCLIESKSLKLYLNSFNQTVMDSVTEVASRIEQDLSGAAGAPVLVELQRLSQMQRRVLGGLPGKLIDTLDVACSVYQPQPALLTVLPSPKPVAETVHSHLLKSNCLVTGQPDWASVVVSYVGQPIDPAGLLRYIVSFRQHNEFHEQCVERIFCDIQARCAPTQLSVWARYTRRGGLDINPWRSSEAGFGAPPDVFDLRQ